MPGIYFRFYQPLRSGLTDGGYLNKKSNTFDYLLFSDKIY